MVFNALSNYFTVPFLASALIIGYLMFFLFYYKTDHWSTIDWSERFFFGFMIGMFAMAVCALVSIPLAFLLVALHVEDLFSQVFYMVPVVFLMVLLALRMDKGAPLSSKWINADFKSFLANHRFHWPWFLIVISIVAYLWLGWNNPFFDSASRSLWFNFIFTLNFTVFLTLCMLIWFVILFSSIPNKVSWSMIFMDLPFAVLKFYFLSPFLRKKKPVWSRNEDEYWV
jgi:hypothetical protein